MQPEKRGQYSVLAGQALPMQAKLAYLTRGAQYQCYIPIRGACEHRFQPMLDALMRPLHGTRWSAQEVGKLGCLQSSITMAQSKKITLGACCAPRVGPGTRAAPGRLAARRPPRRHPRSRRRRSWALRAAPTVSHMLTCSVAVPMSKGGVCCRLRAQHPAAKKAMLRRRAAG